MVVLLAINYLKEAGKQIKGVEVNEYMNDTESVKQSIDKKLFKKIFYSFRRSVIARYGIINVEINSAYKPFKI